MGWTNHELDIYYAVAVNKIVKEIEKELNDKVQTFRGCKVNIVDAVTRTVGNECLFVNQIVQDVKRQLIDDGYVLDGYNNIHIMQLDSHQLIKHVHSNILMRELRSLDITVERSTEKDEELYCNEWKTLEMTGLWQVSANTTMWNINRYEGDKSDYIKEIYDRYDLNRNAVKGIIVETDGKIKKVIIRDGE